MHPGKIKEPNSLPSERAGIRIGWHTVAWLDAARMGVAALVIVLVWSGLFAFAGSLGAGLAGWLAPILVAICGYPIFRGATRAVLARRMTMELSMTIALAAALLVGEGFTAMVLVFFVLIAEEFEKATVNGGRRSIRSRLDLLPRVATIKFAGGMREVATGELATGDLVVFRPGSQLVVDGTVVEGSSFVDESAITGESLAVEKLPGSRVYAGTINGAGALVVRADNVGDDTAYGKIIHAVEQAEKTKASVQKLADKLAGYLVYFALAAALITFVVTRDVKQTISVIIVTGACGIAAGTPLAILGAVGRAAASGTIVKGGLYMERLAQVRTVVFDKTGTLTHGNPRVVDVMPVADATPAAVLQAAAAAESLSEHPLGKAILKRCQELSLAVPPATSFAYKPGRGISCMSGSQKILVGNRAYLHESGIKGPEHQLQYDHVSEVLVARDGQFLGRILIADTLRPQARQAIADLKQMGMKTVLLTGDARQIATVVARQLGIDEFAAGLTPSDKRQRIVQMKAEGQLVAMVGDGVNDAPALSEADVGVAIGSGSDVALDSAGIVLIGNDLQRFVEAIRIARQCRRVIMINFVGTLAVDAVGLGLAFAGLLNPLLAGLVHVGSEVVFLLNSARMFSLFKVDRTGKSEPQEVKSESTDAGNGESGR